MAALDALKRRYGFKRFHLVGQSGGGHTVAGLVQLRSDIGCAVIASGPTSLRSWRSDRFGRPFVGKQRFYDPIGHVNAMKQRPDLRMFVVPDPNDKLVSCRHQLEFVESVKAHNLPITSSEPKAQRRSRAAHTANIPWHKGEAVAAHGAAMV